MVRKMKYTTIIFDLDGTLLNTLPDLTASVNYSLNKFGFPLRTTDEIRSFIGNGVGLLIKRSLPDKTEEAICEQCLKIFKDYYKEHYAVKTIPYDDIYDVLVELKKSGYKIGVVSNKFDLAVKSLCDKFFSGLIDIAIGEIDGTPRKPAPDSLNNAIGYFGADKSNVLYVGDSEVDIKTANNSGVDCLSVTWGFKDKEFLLNNGGENFVNNAKEILDYIKNC